MTIPCVNPCVQCAPSIGGGVGPVDPANPFVNLSSEEPDVDNFIGRRYSLGLPPLGGGPWFAVGCVGFCLSPISQEEADLCAARQAVLCQSTNWPTYVDGPDPRFPFIPQDAQVFANDAQQCAFNCPDGTPFVFTVAAGVFFSVANQETANLMAYSYACNKAVETRLCIGDLIPARTCSGAVYDGSVIASTSRTPVTFLLVTPLPDGLLLAQNETTAFIQGTPSFPGDYAFTMSVTDSAGITVQRQFTLAVFGITNESELPDATLNSPYAVTLVTDGHSDEAVTFAVVSGGLPVGLTLNPDTGEISGTPLVEGAYQFTVRATNGGFFCDKLFDLFVQPEGVDWSGLTWSGESGFGNWSFAGVPEGAVAYAESESGVTAAGVNALGTGTYTGDAINFILTVVSYAISGVPDAGFQIQQDAVTIFEVNPNDITGPFPQEFVIPVSAGVASSITIGGLPVIFGFILCDGSGDNILTMEFTFGPEP